MKLIFVRDGSAVLLSEFGEKPATTGDVVMLGASTLCGSEPEGSIAVTTLYLDRDYVIDQVFWQHAAVLSDRFDAQEFMNERYSEPAQMLHLGERLVHRAARRDFWADRPSALWTTDITYVPTPVGDGVRVLHRRRVQSHDRGLAGRVAHAQAA